MNDDDEVLLEWLRSRGLVSDINGRSIRRPTKETPRPQGDAVEAKHLDMWLSDYMDSRVWICLNLRDPEDLHAKYILRDAVRLWMLGLYW